MENNDTLPGKETIDDIADVIYEFTLLNHAFCQIEAEKVYKKHIEPLEKSLVEFSDVTFKLRQKLDEHEQTIADLHLKLQGQQNYIIQLENRLNNK